MRIIDQITYELSGFGLESRCCGIQITGKCTRESKKFKVDIFTHSPLPLFQAELTPVSSHLVINKIK